MSSTKGEKTTALPINGSINGPSIQALLIEKNIKRRKKFISSQSSENVYSSSKYNLMSTQLITLCKL
jgi:hypothetical protein